jgi:5-methylcytosine-specific restriction endonuclease McrA
MAEQTKVCTKCGMAKPLAEFHKQKAGKFGVKSTCKTCDALYKKAHYQQNKERISVQMSEYYEQNRDSILEQKKEYLAENREKIVAYRVKYHRRNMVRRNALRRQHYYENIEYERSRSRIYKRKNPNVCRQHFNKYRSKKRNAEGTHTATDIQEVFKAQGGMCAGVCGEPLPEKYHVDHWIPLSKGGSNNAGNLRLMCPSCNLSKGAKDPHEWSGRLL